MHMEKLRSNCGMFVTRHSVEPFCRRDSSDESLAPMLLSCNSLGHKTLPVNDGDSISLLKHNNLVFAANPCSNPNTVVANAKMKKELQEIENRILFLLSNSKGNILDDHELIEILASSKKTSTEITLKVGTIICISLPLPLEPSNRAKRVP